MAFIELKKVETTFDVAGPITVNVSDIVKGAPLGLTLRYSELASHCSKCWLPVPH